MLTREGHENTTYELSGDHAWSFAEFAIGRPATPMGDTVAAARLLLTRSQLSGCGQGLLRGVP